jgi:polyphenol oxidase
VARSDGAVAVRIADRVHAAWSDASSGDLRPVGTGPADGTALAEFATGVAAPSGATFDRIAWATQVHGSRVVDVDDLATPTDVVTPADVATPADGVAPDVPGPVTCRHLGRADALVAASPDTALCVLTADCGPLALGSPEGIFAAVHAGWRGLVAGVVGSAVRQMRSRGATEVTGVLGPCIHAGCYEFGPTELDAVAGSFGPAVRSTTTEGHPALDLVAGVAAAVAAAGATLTGVVDVCTACGGGRFSHRARSDAGRLALVVWSTAGVAA